jgi:hypothetical protein
MTPLEKPVSRKTVSAYRVLYQKPRPVVVTLCPGEERLEFRELGRRARFPLPIDIAFKYAVRLKATADAVERRAKRKAKQ